MTRPRVLFVGPYPPPYSGPELGMQLFLESELLRERFDIRFVQTNFRRSNEHKGRVDGHMARAFFSYFWRLFSALTSHRPDLVYYPVTATQVGWMGRDVWTIFLSRMFRARVVLHLRGSHLKLNMQRFHPGVQRAIRRACASVSSAIVQADRLMDQFDGLVPLGHVRVLYNALDTAEFDMISPATKEPGTVLFLGHMTQAKGYCDLMKAVPAVAAQVPELRVRVGGTLRKGERGVFYDQSTGQPLEYEDPFEMHGTAIAGALSKHYEYLGVTTGEEKRRHLQQSSIFCLPSYSEGMSRAVLEAMASGAAIVATPVGSHDEILKDGHNGFLVKPGDVGGLAAALVRLLTDDSLRQRIAVTNYREAREQFDIRKISEQFAVILSGALA